jgi:hypothetical protein
VQAAHAASEAARSVVVDVGQLPAIAEASAPAHIKS